MVLYRCFRNASSPPVSKEGMFSLLGHRRDTCCKPEQWKLTGSEVNRDRPREYPGQQVYPAPSRLKRIHGLYLWRVEVCHFSKHNLSHPSKLLHRKCIRIHQQRASWKILVYLSIAGLYQN